MKNVGLNLLSIMLLLVQLVSPAQAVVSSMTNVVSSSMKMSHCMQKMQHHSGSQHQHDNTRCQQDKACEASDCHSCQSYTSMIMLINLHQQFAIPTLSTTTLIHVADYLQSIPPENRYRPPINLL